MTTTAAMDASRAEAATVSFWLSVGAMVTWVFPVLGLILPVVSLVISRRGFVCNRAQVAFFLSLISLTLGCLWSAFCILFFVSVAFGYK